MSWQEASGAPGRRRRLEPIFIYLDYLGFAWISTERSSEARRNGWRRQEKGEHLNEPH
jgi:hypothetical protein